MNSNSLGEKLFPHVNAYIISQCILCFTILVCRSQWASHLLFIMSRKFANFSRLVLAFSFNPVNPFSTAQSFSKASNAHVQRSYPLKTRGILIYCTKRFVKGHYSNYEGWSLTIRISLIGSKALFGQSDILAHAWHFMFFRCCTITVAHQFIVVMFHLHLF